MEGLLNHFVFVIFSALYKTLDILLPTFYFPNIYDVVKGLAWLIQLIAALGFVLPVGTILEILALSVGFKIFLFTLWIINWIIKIIADIIP